MKAAEENLIFSGTDKQPFVSGRRSWPAMLAARGYIAEYYGKYHNHVDDFLEGGAFRNSSWGSPEEVKATYSTPDAMMTQYNKRCAEPQCPLIVILVLNCAIRFVNVRSVVVFAGMKSSLTRIYRTQSGDRLLTGSVSCALKLGVRMLVNVACVR